MKSNVFHLANALRKSGLSLSDAVRRAWATIKLKAQMLRNPVSFFYTKDDGSERFAVGFFGAAPATKTVTTKQESPKVTADQVLRYARRWLAVVPCRPADFDGSLTFAIPTAPAARPN